MPADIDNVTSAETPNPELGPLLNEIDKTTKMVRVEISTETRRVCSTVRAANDIHVHHARILRLQTTVMLSIEYDLHLMTRYYSLYS